MKSKVIFRKIAFVRGHKNDQNRKLTLTFSPQRQTPALHVADVPATAGKLAKSCAVMHGSWLNFRSKSPSPRKRPLLKFPNMASTSSSLSKKQEIDLLWKPIYFNNSSLRLFEVSNSKEDSWETKGIKFLVLLIKCSSMKHNYEIGLVSPLL